MPIKFLLLGGGGGREFFRRGVEVPILFLWAWGFFLFYPSISSVWMGGFRVDVSCFVKHRSNTGDSARL